MDIALDLSTLPPAGAFALLVIYVICYVLPDRLSPSTPEHRQR